MKNIYGKNVLLDQMYQIFTKGKLALDAFLLDLGRTMAENCFMVTWAETLIGSDHAGLGIDTVY